MWRRCGTGWEHRSRQVVPVTTKISDFWHPDRIDVRLMNRPAPVSELAHQVQHSVMRILLLYRAPCAVMKSCSVRYAARSYAVPHIHVPDIERLVKCGWCAGLVPGRFATGTSNANSSSLLRTHIITIAQCEVTYAGCDSDEGRGAGPRRCAPLTRAYHVPEVMQRQFLGVIPRLICL